MSPLDFKAHIPLEIVFPTIGIYTDNMISTWRAPTPGQPTQCIFHWLLLGLQGMALFPQCICVGFARLRVGFARLRVGSARLRVGSAMRFGSTWLHVGFLDTNIAWYFQREMSNTSGFTLQGNIGFRNSNVVCYFRLFLPM